MSQLCGSRAALGGRALVAPGRAGRPAVRSRGTPARALFTKKKQAPAPKAPPKKERKQGFLSQFTEAIDFAQVRSESDRDLLDAAKQNKSLGKKGSKEKMSREQYAALRRKVGGTARDFWKDYVEADETKAVRSKGGADVPALPFLLAVVLGLAVATGVVVSQTGPAPAPQQASLGAEQ